MLWPTSRIDGGAPSNRISAAGWKNPVKPVGMWLFVSTSVAMRPASPRMMCIAIAFLFAEALQRFEHGQVVRVYAQRLLPRLAREVLVAEALVKRALHRQDVLVVGVLAIQLADLDERQLVLPGAIKLLHARERQQVARLRRRGLVVARLAGRALVGRLRVAVVAAGAAPPATGPAQTLARGPASRSCRISRSAAVMVAESTASRGDGLPERGTLTS